MDFETQVIRFDGCPFVMSATFAKTKCNVQLRGVLILVILKERCIGNCITSFVIELAETLTVRIHDFFQEHRIIINIAPTYRLMRARLNLLLTCMSELGLVL